MNKHTIFTGAPGTGKTRAMRELETAYAGQVDTVWVDAQHTSPSFIEKLAKNDGELSRKFVFIDDLRSDDKARIDAVKTLIETVEDGVEVFVTTEEWKAINGWPELGTRTKVNPDGSVASVAYEPVAPGNAVVVRTFQRR